MCIIVYKPHSIEVGLDLLEDCWSVNRDGAGLMFAEDGKLKVAKGFMKWRDFKKYFKKFGKDRMTALPMTFHFRIATHGSVGPANCHPFLIHDGLGFAHNGIISEVNIPKESDISDTEAFAQQYLASLNHSLVGGLTINHLAAPNRYGGTPINKLLGRFIGGSKLMFMDATGDTAIVNESSGVWENEIWFSNRTYKRYTKPVHAHSGAGFGSTYTSPRSGGQVSTATPASQDGRSYASAYSRYLGTGIEDTSYLESLEYACNTCGNSFTRMESRRIRWVANKATCACPACDGWDTEEIQIVEEDEDEVYWECYDCQASFWASESDGKVDLHGSTYLICPWCTSTRTFNEDDIDVVDKFGDCFFDGDAPEKEVVEQARLDYETYYDTVPEPEPDALAAIEDEDAKTWEDLQHTVDAEWEQLLDELDSELN